MGPNKMLGWVWKCTGGHQAITKPEPGRAHVYVPELWVALGNFSSPLPPTHATHQLAVQEYHTTCILLAGNHTPVTRPFCV